MALAGVSARKGDIEEYHSLTRESSSCKAARRRAVLVSGFLIRRYTAVLTGVLAEPITMSSSLSYNVLPQCHCIDKLGVDAAIATKNIEASPVSRETRVEVFVAAGKGEI